MDAECHFNLLYLHCQHPTARPPHDSKHSALLLFHRDDRAPQNNMMLQMFQQFVKQQVMAQMAGKDAWGWPWVIDPSNRPIEIVLQNLSTQEDIAESEILTFGGGF